jgi:hypothetical protein
MGTLNVTVHQGLEGELSFSVEDHGIVYEGAEALNHVHALGNPQHPEKGPVLRASLEQKVSDLYVATPLPEQETDEEAIQMGVLKPLKAMVTFFKRFDPEAIGRGTSVIEVMSKTVDVATRLQKYIPSDPTSSQFFSGLAKTAAECKAQWFVADKLEALFAHSLCTMLWYQCGH